MKRQDKYPDTDTFHYYNANPKNRITGDCVVRAISLATGISYEDTVMALAEVQCKTGYDGCSKEGYDRYLSKLGYIKCNQPRKLDNKKYTGKEFCELLQKIHNNKIHIINIGGHHLSVIVDNKINDIWDCSDGCIGNYWVRG